MATYQKFADTGTESQILKHPFRRTRHPADGRNQILQNDEPVDRRDLFPKGENALRDGVRKRVFRESEWRGQTAAKRGEGRSDCYHRCPLNIKKFHQMFQLSEAGVALMVGCFMRTRETHVMEAEIFVTEVAVP